MTGGDFVTPAYGDRSLADVVPALARALGRGDVFPGSEQLSLRLPDADSYVLLLVDGLGHALLAEHAEHAPYLASLLPGTAPLTVGVPSTTATSLTSLGTALPPGGHGLVGYTSRIPGTDRLLNALMWSKDVDPHLWQPHRTAFARLAAAGVRTTVVNKREFAGSGLTEASARGACFVGVDRVGERQVAVQEASAAVPSLTYIYDGDLDWTGHRYGVASPQWRAQLGLTDLAVRRLRETLPEATRIVVVADHGMVDADPDDRVDVDEVPQLARGVVLLGGEARFRHVYCRAAAAVEVRDRWRGVLGDRAEVLLREEAVAQGWFGAVTEVVLPRIGEVVAACRGRFTVLGSHTFPHESRLVGVHGSLTPAEMLVPVLVS